MLQSKLNGESSEESEDEEDEEEKKDHVNMVPVETMGAAPDSHKDDMTIATQVHLKIAGRQSFMTNDYLYCN